MNVCEQINRLGISIPWPHQSYMEMPAVPAAVPSARLHARRVLGEWEMNCHSEVVELIVSELVTNSVRASFGLFPGKSDRRPSVRLWLSSDGDRVFIQVWDGSEARPVLQNAGPRALSGRGLLLVEAVSEGWGCYWPVTSPGKIVWSLVAAADLLAAPAVPDVPGSPEQLT
jgi:anti-sigma regulatory factor (Ser/Thr protein kinase)